MAVASPKGVPLDPEQAENFEDVRVIVRRIQNPDLIRLRWKSSLPLRVR
jgi:hypothetical protein